MSDLHPSAPSPGPARKLRGPLIILAVIAMLLVGAALVSASLAEAGSRWFGGGRHAQCSHGGQGFDPERAREHAEYATGWVLRHLDASDEQEVRIQQIVAGVVDEMSQLTEPHREHKDAFLALLSAEQIDRAKLEELRAAEFALADTASGVLTQALADIADTLSSEQRAELLEHATRHRERRGHGWRH